MVSKRSLFWLAIFSVCSSSEKASLPCRLSCSPTTTISWSGKSSKQSAAADSHSSNLQTVRNQNMFFSWGQETDHFPKLSLSFKNTHWGRLRVSGSSLSRHVLEITRSWVATRALHACCLAGEVRMQSSMGNSTICNSCSSVCCFQTSSNTRKGLKSRKGKEYIPQEENLCSYEMLFPTTMADYESYQLWTER